MNSGKSNDGRRDKCGKTSLSSNVRRTHTHSLTRWLGKLMMNELISMMMINDCQRGRVLWEADTVSNVITRTFNAHTHTHSQVSADFMLLFYLLYKKEDAKKSRKSGARCWRFSEFTVKMMTSTGPERRGIFLVAAKIKQKI